MVNAAEEIMVKQRINKVEAAAQVEIHREVEKKSGFVYLEVIVHEREANKIEEIIAQTSAEKMALDLPSEETIPQRFETLNKEMRDNAKERERLLKKAKKFVRIEKEIKFAYDALLHRKERFLARQKMSDFSLSTVITGWLPKEKFKPLTDEAKKIFPTVCIDEISPKKNELGPVALQNTSLMRPFEAVTDIFGRPKYTELDPTPALSLFFLIAFGLALTDAGYGLVMMGIMWMAEKFFRLKKDMQKMVRLLFYAGAATVVFGAITGGWFGINLENLPPSSGKNFLLSLKLIDPVTEPMNLLLVAFGIGVVQLLFAWVVRGYDHWRKGDMVAVLFDDAAWVTMVIAILLWAGSTRGIFLAGSTSILKTIVIANALVLVLTQGRSYKNPLLKIGGGILSLYGLVGFISDTLSYSRLLALGLATGIIALVVNLMGAMAADSLPGVGWIVAGLVLLVGHVFNIGINALGAFIHSGRLQFVEFFPKFIEGGGSPYKPLGRVNKFVDNPNDFV
jgi:V/A-type H+-transporting ATPase subunit I